MHTRTTLLAALLAVFPVAALAQSAGPLMSPPGVLAAPQLASLIATLAARRAAHGIDADHGFAVARQHPGVQGTLITRVDHTYKGVRIFGAESVLVTDTAGALISEDASDRRLNLGKGRPTAWARPRPTSRSRP